jgi:FlaA1/EpsC-like NDP-sugar epimerase
LEITVKKKIRAIQYGIGPIGASIVKLLREKQSVDIVGAIYSDPAKVGKDLGEVVGAADAPRVFGGGQHGAPGGSRGLAAHPGLSFDRD